MNGSENKRPAGIGTGYLSIMMIFVVLCMTMLAALSYSAASAEKGFSLKSGEYTAEYYAADLEANRTLAEIDGIAAEYSDYADLSFISEIEEMEGMELKQLPDSIEISWLTPINDRQSISSSVRYSGGGYVITEWRTVLTSDTESKPLNVWSGE